MKQISLFFGSASETFLRLWSRAPDTRILPEPIRAILPPSRRPKPGIDQDLSNSKIDCVLTRVHSAGNA